MKDTPDVLIVGGGFVGLAAAAALDDIGARVTILEACPGPNPAFRGELIHPRGVRMLSALRLLDPLLDAGGVRVPGFAVFPPQCVDAILLPYRAAAGFGLALDHEMLVAAMSRGLTPRPRVTIKRGARVQDLLLEHRRVVGVRLAGGEQHRAPLVVGADGRHSRVRRLAGIPVETELLSYSVALALDGAARALARASHGHVFVDGPGPTLAYPCGHDRVRMCIDVPRDAVKGDRKLRELLRERYVPRLWPTELQTAMLDALERNPLTGAANHAITTHACAGPGLALVGDAGGCSHPITATGMTTGLHDVVTLAACIGRHGLNDEALGAYQRSRYRFVRAREAFTCALYDALRGASPGAAALREGMFAYWQRSERARTASMDVLCGDDERVIAFVAEYLRVVAGSGLRVGRGLVAFDRRNRRAAAARLRALLGTAASALEVAVKKAGSTFALERSRSLSLSSSAHGSGLDARSGERRTEDPDDGALNGRVSVHSRDAVEQP
jgi:squalene monooxygenase